ncbi:hypothetical protein PCC8801_3543 [Rippkaea orientalis PCC 8801]|uniref:Uncharacterized protein n=1 Tax=Rippkaea orientalis (strain PCC 8801 / RF-1) TaxID=41431 RepID=B7K1G6_RIPO1|nr:hypothetical protein [Rippkaea orientalis]ACK67508.1 hypothetical protein PCC8801_3543 [Rippkaea orientalis PCC 8801]
MLLAHGNHSHTNHQETITPFPTPKTHSTNNDSTHKSGGKTEVLTLSIQLNDSPLKSSINSLPGLGELIFLMIVITPIFLTLIKKKIQH